MAARLGYSISSSLRLSQKLPIRIHHPSSFHVKSSTKPFPIHCAGMTLSNLAPSQERRSANYMPNLWEHDYIESLARDGTGNAHSRRTEELKEKVRAHLMESGAIGPVAKLELVNDVRRLGVDYHFREEIRDVMESLRTREMGSVLSEGDLYSTALLFSLFREHLLEISPDVFDGFKNKDGSFKGCLRGDVRGLLSLYEASFFAFEGEDALDEARSFTTQHLKDLLLQGEITDPALNEMVIKALELPLNWAVPRLHVRWSIENYTKRESNSSSSSSNPEAAALLELARLDFNVVQGIHRRELFEASSWWKELGLAGKLGFCRDRVVENYFCVLGSLCEPQFWYYRERMTRIFCLIAAMDDIYDIYGTLEELEVFTEAVVRWDVNAIERLPECMKLCFLALFNTVNEIAYNDLKEKGLEIHPYLKQTWAELCKAWLVEARWYHNNEKTTFNEYLENSWVSMGWPVVCVHGFFLLIQSATKETLLHLQSCPDLIRCSSTLIRLWNDLSTSEAERERGDIPKSIQCLMHEKNLSESAAHEEIRELIFDTWKRQNQSRPGSKILGEDFLRLVMDGTRTLRFIYHRGDGYARPDRETKASISSLLFEPLSLHAHR